MKNIMKFRSLFSAVVLLPLMAFQCRDYRDTWNHYAPYGMEDVLYAQEVKNRCVMRAVRALDAVKYLGDTEKIPFNEGEYVIRCAGYEYNKAECIITGADTLWRINGCDVRHAKDGSGRWHVDFSGEIGCYDDAGYYEFSADAALLDEYPELPEDSSAEWMNDDMSHIWKVTFSGKKTEDSPYYMEFGSNGSVTACWLRCYDYDRCSRRLSLTGYADIAFFNAGRKLDSFRFEYVTGKTDVPADCDFY